jgi:crotonobetainyl-CoA hydratase
MLSAEEAQAMRLPAVVKALESEDSDEGVRAFREKRAPKWTGK